MTQILAAMANMSLPEIRAELARLQAENEQLKAKKAGQLSFKVSSKGALSVYGLGRFPVTLYVGQWKRLIEAVSRIEAFMADNAGTLSIEKPAKVA